MSLLSKNRRDPWWELDGPAARGARRRRRAKAAVAFVVSLTAVSGAAAAWAIYLGFAAALGLRVVVGAG